ncbi:MAG: GatB/YqeY domain-containing protein [Candidatus Promineifilaceae bacterium]
MTIRQQIKADLTKAMKARQSETVSTLRALLGEIANAEAVEIDTDFVPMIGRTNDVPRRLLTDEDIRQILQAEAERHQSAIAEFENVGRQDAAERLQAGLELINGYLN